MGKRIERKAHPSELSLLQSSAEMLRNSIIQFSTLLDGFTEESVDNAICDDYPFNISFDEAVDGMVTVVDSVLENLDKLMVFEWVADNEFTKVVAKKDTFWTKKGKTYFMQESDFCGHCWHIYVAPNHEAHIFNEFIEDDFNELFEVRA